ncbi:MAG TPA: SDR family oxidoreductase [Acidimicrobiales bacterium]|nr:SDR family oxidoreductase [Acidimicrobiales bacterium]
MKVAGSNVVVTGASAGIGAALAPMLTAAGATVAIVARREERLRAMVERGDATRYYVCDMADPDAAETMILRAWDELDGVDILVNNAAIPKRRSVQDLTRDEIDETMRVNFTSPVRMSQALLPKWLERDHGMVVNVSSFGGRAGILHEAAYCASKFALCGWSESMAMDLWRTGVKVRLIIPGAIDTEIWDLPGNDAPFFNGDKEPPATVAQGIIDCIEGDSFELYVPDMKSIAEFKMTHIDAFLQGNVEFGESQQPG